MSLLTQISELVTSITRPGTETSEGKNTRWVQLSMYALAVAEIILAATVKQDSWGSVSIIIAAIFAALKTNKDYTDARTRLKESAAGVLANPAISTVLDVIRSAAEAEPPVTPPRASIFNSPNPIFPKAPAAAAEEMPVLRLSSPEKGEVRKQGSCVEITTTEGDTETQEFSTRLEAVTFANKLRQSPDLPPGAKVHVT